MIAIEEIEEGVAYHDGQQRRIYDPSDRASVEAVLFKRSFKWSIGPLTVEGSLDTSVPSISVTATLLGVTIASCQLSPTNPGCTIGGSVDGFKAKLTLGFQQKPFALLIGGTLCAPFVGCKNFNTKIPLGVVEDTDAEVAVG